jgi:hypothetical protein
MITRGAVGHIPSVRKSCYGSRGLSQLHRPEVERRPGTDASRMQRCLFAIFVCLVCGMPVAGAQTKVDTDWATNELSAEMIECSQFFLISWACFRDFPNPQAQAAANDYRTASDRISELGFSVGKSVGLLPEAAAARMRIANDRLSKEINKNCANISILQERLAEFCKNLMQHPDERWNQLMRCSVQKQAFPCEGH